MRRTLFVLVAVGLAVPVATSLVAQSSPAGEHYVAAWVAIEAIAAAGWSALALQAWSQRRSGPIPRWVALGLLLMTTSEVLKAWSLADDHAPHGVAGYVQLIAAAIAVTAGLSGLWISIRAEGASSSDLTRALIDTERRLAQIEEHQRQRLHDARSAVMGVVGASKLLAQPDLSTSVDPALLHAMVTNELDRLQGLLAIEEREPIVEFELADALSVVVLARRMDGTAIDFDCTNVRVVGRPRATATVIDNLLRNAHIHAPRSRVCITARTIGLEAEIVVSDNGPGIPMRERTHVLQAGVRGASARGSGSGLGLYSAERAMIAQSGSLRIGGTLGGGTRIALRLPAAAVTRALAS
jgi:signal transduction histidine kinase